MEFFEISVFKNLAVLEVDYAIGFMGEFFVMSDDNERGPMSLI